jgi:hypothetical protein
MIFLYYTNHKVQHIASGEVGERHLGLHIEKLKKEGRLDRYTGDVYAGDGSAFGNLKLEIGEAIDI